MDVEKTKATDKEYLLFVFTKKSFYYLYNLGQVQDPYGDWTDAQNRSYSSYEKSSTGEDKYFIPSNATEAAARDEYGNYDVTKWTTETTSGTYSEEYDGVKYLAEKRINSNIRTAIYNGEYVYGNLDIEKIKSTKLNSCSSQKSVLKFFVSIFFLAPGNEPYKT